MENICPLIILFILFHYCYTVIPSSSYQYTAYKAAVTFIRKLDVQQLYLARNLVAKSLTKISQKNDAKSSIQKSQENFESSSISEVKIGYSFEKMNEVNTLPSRKIGSGFSARLNDTKASVANVKLNNIIPNSNNIASRQSFTDSSDIVSVNYHQFSSDKEFGNHRARVNLYESRKWRSEDADSIDEEGDQSKVENFWPLKSNEIPTSKINTLEIVTKTETDNRNKCKISNEDLSEELKKLSNGNKSKISNKDLSEKPKTLSTESSKQSKTSTEILEGLEAEVEYLLSL
ncbi:hypothetical protein Avbf_06307 [Armadillidium vulgare]|nr:hypothetical protein Avbf_06307 [Armadillidium vulgare]